jgi:hypothetical protein
MKQQRAASVSTPRSETISTLGSATNELIATAKKHSVAIREAQVSFISNGLVTIAHAPLVGIERYTDANFATGSPIQVILIDSSNPVNLPKGSYLVKAQFQPGAASGKALFVDGNGKLVTQRELIIRTQAQAASVFPDVYTNPVDIPIITSTHVWIGDPTHIGDPKYGHYAVDCSGWQPYRILYYS